MKHEGYDIIHTDPGTLNQMRCRVCGSECKLTRNVPAPPRFGQEREDEERLNDVFICPNAAEEWHVLALKLVQEIERSPSKRVVELMTLDLKDLLDEHVPGTLHPEPRSWASSPPDSQESDRRAVIPMPRTSPAPEPIVEPSSGTSLTDEILDRGQDVLSLDWDSGATGNGAGSEVFYHYKDKYYYISDAGETFGPYDSLDEALDRHEMPSITSATEQIESNRLSAEEVIQRARIDESVPDGYPILVNGEEWIYRHPVGFERLR